MTDAPGRADEPFIEEHELSVSSHSALGWAVLRFRQHRLAMAGLIVLLLIAAAAILAPLIAQYDPTAIDLAARSQPPSAEHWLGTDRTGRDVLSRALYGGRVSLLVGITAVTVSAIIGVGIGSIAGHGRGWLDSLLMRFTDMVLIFPRLVIIIALVAVVGPSLWTTVAVLGLLSWPPIARIVRGDFLHLREEEFVLAAENIGAPSRVIIWRHILPNIIGPITVALTLLVADAILLEASLSFLGLGIQIPTPSWGNMIQDAQSINVLENLPWMWIVPGTLIITTVLAINFVGDGLRDAFDPRSSDA